MAISFNNIPENIRTPGTYIEVDNSRALKGLIGNPHKVLILGQRHKSEGNAVLKTLYSITRDNLADGYFGAGSNLARMCNIYKKNNQTTEIYAMALSGGTATASAVIHFSVALSHATGVVSTNNEIVHLLINGSKFELTLTSGWSVGLVNSALKALINANSNIPCVASTTAASTLTLECVNSGVIGNYLDLRFNYFDGQSNPTCFGDSILTSNFGVGGVGVGTVDIADAWTVIQDEQFHHIIVPWIDDTNLDALETELADRFKPLKDKQGHGYTCARGTHASCTTEGNARNSPYTTYMGAYNSPTDPAEWAAALGAVCSYNLNNDPARPLHTLKLANVLPPPSKDRFTREERDLLLYDGISTFMVDTTGNVLLERVITTYQTNSLGIPDSSYLDITTLFTLGEIRYQYKARMITRFILTRQKLADDTFPAQPGMNVVRPKDVKAETIALFADLQDRGLIENLEAFIENLRVERNASNVNRVDVLLPPDLINQFMILAGTIQFIL
jgi:phage tail sheath gpL-like